MTNNLHRISVRSAHPCVALACLFLLPLVASGCGGDSGESVSADYSPDSAFTLTHPDGGTVSIPAGARTTSLKIVASVPPPSRRPGAVGTVVVASLTLTPPNPGLNMPATVSMPIMPSSLPGGATVQIVQGTGGGVFVPLPTRRQGAAVLAETVTFGDFFAVAMVPADGGVLPMDMGVRDAGASDAGAADAGSSDAAVDDAAVDAGPRCGDGVYDPATEQCDNGENNHETCMFAADCTTYCLYCIE